MSLLFFFFHFHYFSCCIFIIVIFIIVIFIIKSHIPIILSWMIEFCNINGDGWSSVDHDVAWTLLQRCGCRKPCQWTQWLCQSDLKVANNWPKCSNICKNNNVFVLMCWVCFVCGWKCSGMVRLWKCSKINMLQYTICTTLFTFSRPGQLFVPALKVD